MNLRQILTVVIVLCLAGVAQAAEERAWYGGVKTGMATLNETGFGDPTMAGVLFGYKFARGDWGSVAFEIDYVTDVSEGSIRATGVPPGVVNAEWGGETFAGCFAYRSPRNLYFKGKVGYMDASADLSVSAPGIVMSESVSDDDFAAGIGFGWRFTANSSIEVEWSRGFFDTDLDVFTVGYNF